MKQTLIYIESICLFYLGSINQTLYHGYHFFVLRHTYDAAATEDLVVALKRGRLYQIIGS